MAPQVNFIQSLLTNIQNQLQTMQSNISLTRSSLIGQRAATTGTILGGLRERKNGGILGLGLMPTLKKPGEEEAPPAEGETAPTGELPGGLEII